MKPNTAPIITLIAAMPTVPDKSHLDGMIMNIYGIVHVLPKILYIVRDYIWKILKANL
jgi:hypothetical protein